MRLVDIKGDRVGHTIAIAAFLVLLTNNSRTWSEVNVLQDFELAFKQRSGTEEGNPPIIELAGVRSSDTPKKLLSRIALQLVSGHRLIRDERSERVFGQRIGAPLNVEAAAVDGREAEAALHHILAHRLLLLAEQPRAQGGERREALVGRVGRLGRCHRRNRLEFKGGGGGYR